MESNVKIDVGLDCAAQSFGADSQPAELCQDSDPIIMELVFCMSR
jgi:hypothetical protein